MCLFYVETSFLVVTPVWCGGGVCDEPGQASNPDTCLPGNGKKNKEQLAKEVERKILNVCPNRRAVPNQSDYRVNMGVAGLGLRLGLWSAQDEGQRP